MTYGPATFDVATSNSKGDDVFTRNILFDHDLGLKVIQNVGQYPLHDVTYAPAKFEVATPNGLGGDAYFSKMQNTSH